MNYTKKTSSTSINSHKQASGLANHNINPGIIVKSENIKEQSSVRFQRIRCESPEVSVLSNASNFHLHFQSVYNLGDRDALSKGFFDNQGSKKRKLSIESSDSDLPLGEEIGKISSSAIDGKKGIATSGPKIVVTAAEGTKLKETVKMTVASVLSLPSIKEKLPLGARIMKFLHIKDRRHTINLVGDQIKKKQMLQEKNANALKMNSGRLLQIISDQALNGKNAEVSKAFKVALVIFSKIQL